MGKTLDYDAVVVGAGPAGLLAAMEIAKRGYRTLVVEEHSTIGLPDHCAGLVSTKGLASLGLKLPKTIIQNIITGARIYSPAGHSINVERGEKEAYVIDRSRFDQWLADKAVKYGTEIWTSTKARRFKIIDEKRVTIKIENEKTKKITARLLIDAEGSRGILLRMAGLRPVSRKSKLPAYQVEMENVETENNIVKMFYGNKVAPGFFAWTIPFRGNKARVGLAARKNVKKRLELLLKRQPIISNSLKNAKVIRKFGGVVLSGLPIVKTYSDKFLVVGDAAGIVKATTGGGIIIGGGTAKIAGQVAAKALEQENTSEKFLRIYEKMWRERYYRDLLIMYLAQRFIISLSDKGLDSLVKSAQENDLIKIIRAEGDMDYQGKVIVQLLRQPRLVLSALKVLRNLRFWYD